MVLNDCTTLGASVMSEICEERGTAASDFVPNLRAIYGVQQGQRSYSNKETNRIGVRGE